MKHKIISILLSAIMLLSILPIFAIGKSMAAPLANGGNDSAEASTYLDQCSYTPTYASFETNVVAGRVYTQPCTTAVDSSSSAYKLLPKGTAVTATGYVTNTQSELWYQISLDGGSYYIIGTSLTFSSYLNDVAIYSAEAPSGNLTYGKSYDLKEVVTSRHAIASVTASISGPTNLSYTLSPNVHYRFAVSGTLLDNNMTFNTLSTGSYTYTLKAAVSASCPATSYCSSFTKTIASSFTVVSSSSDTITISNYSCPNAVSLGSSFGIYGTVTSATSNITSLTAGVFDEAGNRKTGKTVSPNARTYSLANVNNDIVFNILPVGYYYYRVIATNSSGVYTVLDRSFVVYSGMVPPSITPTPTATPTPTPTATPSASTAYTLGDVNGDGTVTSADAALILRYSVKLQTLSSTALAAADVNASGTVDPADAALILRWLVHLSNLDGSTPYTSPVPPTATPTPTPTATPTPTPTATPTPTPDTRLPLDGTVRISSPYGVRSYKSWEFHKGIDLKTSGSTNVYAVAAGTVVASSSNNRLGNYIAIQHSGGWTSLYYHLASRKVSVGNTVSKGTVIGIMGNTGDSAGVHLHFMTCDNWYGGIYATQDTHYVAPHTYVAQVLKIVYYTPNYESASSDQMIIRDFNMADTIAYKASFDISTMGAYIAAANTVTKIRVTIYDKTSGKLEVSGEESNPSLTRINSGIYRIYKISGTLDRSVLFGNLSRGVKTIYFTVTSSTGRSRIVYTKDFTVS